MPRKVLIVDDALTDRTALAHIVTGAGHVAVLATTGQEAVERARKEKPDLILMDVNMPDLDGFAATRQLKADEQTRNIRIVLISSKGERADKVWGHMLGASAYVTKPYQPEQILAQLDA